MLKIAEIYFATNSNVHGKPEKYVIFAQKLFFIHEINCNKNK